MSSHENSQSNETWNYNINGEENLPRPPKPVTEIRLLSSMVLKSENKASLSRPSSGLGGGGCASTAGFGSVTTCENQTSHISPQTSQQPVTHQQIKSSLNAGAKEFVPRSETIVASNSYQSQECSQNDGFNVPDTTPEFFEQPHDLNVYSNYIDSYYPDGPYEGYDEDPKYFLDDFNALNLRNQFEPLYPLEAPSLNANISILDRFKQTLHILNLNPGNMEEYLRPICEMIRNSSDKTEIINDLVESLFNQSIQEANFRYTGARICQFLNINLNEIPHFSGFNKIFIKRCKQDYDRREQLKNGSREDQERLRGLAMFMAEIFLNVEALKLDGTVERINFLPDILIDFMKTLLSIPTDLDVKCSCQLLKLSGGLIEDDVKISPDKCVKFEEIFAQLQSLESSPDLTENTKFIIDTVLKLKKSNWNRSLSSPVRKPTYLSASESNDFQAPDPVFYNQMGTPCSRTEAGFPEEDSEDGAYVLNEEEEAAFMTWQQEQEGVIDEEGALVINDTGYDSYRLEDGEMGDEMEAAYEEFLQGQTYQTCVTDPQEQCIPTSVPQIFNHPPPNMSQHQDFSVYQQQHILPSNQQQNQMPQHNQDQQQHYQMPPYHQDQQQQQQQNYNRYHYHC